MNTMSAGRAGQGVAGLVWDGDFKYMEFSTHMPYPSSVISSDRLAYEVAQKNSEEIADDMDYIRILWFMVPPYKKF